MRILLFLFMVLNTTLHADVKFLGKVGIDQGKEIIQRVSNIAVTEDGYFIFPDNKAGNIKLFSPDGKLARVWGRKGLGPDDFVKPIFCDYRKPYLLLMDYGKYKLMKFERTGKLHFKKTNEFLIIALGYDFKLCGDEVMVSGFKMDKNKSKFEMYILNPLKKKMDFLIPAYEKYGLESRKEYKRKYPDKLASIGLNAYFDYTGDDVFYAWEGNLDIIKINRKTRKLVRFSHKSKNYKTPELTSKLTRLYKARSTKMYTETQKMSYVNGVITGPGYVCVTYANYNKEPSGWQSYIQLYNPEGIFLSEQILEGAVNTTNYPDPAFYFDKDAGTLYFLSRTMDEEFNDIYAVCKYKVSLRKND